MYNNPVSTLKAAAIIIATHVSVWECTWASKKVRGKLNEGYLFITHIN